MDVRYVFTPLFTQLLVALYPDAKGTPGAPLMSQDGQFGQDQQAVVGDFYLLDQMGCQDQDPAAPEPIELRAMICCRLTKEMLPLPTAIKIHPAFDFLKILLAEVDIIPDDDFQVCPVSKVYGRCEQCQTMLSECPTKKDVGLDATEVMYVMMLPEWCELLDWSAREEGCS